MTATHRGMLRLGITGRLLRAAGIRCADGDPCDTPLVSPGVGPLDGLPRPAVVTGTHDVLIPVGFRRRAKDARQRPPGSVRW